MKTISLVTLFASVLMTSTAFADLLTLKSDRGVGIRVYYGMDAGANGNSAWAYASGVHVEVDHAIPGQTRVVLINKCRSFAYPSERTFEWAYDCEYGQNGTWAPQNCMLRGDTGAEQFYNSRPRTILVRSANHSFEINCRQEIAVELRRGEWLRDPYNGRNNFEFQFPNHY